MKNLFFISVRRRKQWLCNVKKDPIITKKGTSYEEASSLKMGELQKNNSL